MGTLGAVPLYLLLARAGGAPAVAGAALVATVVGVWAASVVATDLGAKDPQVVVIDEVAGLLVTMTTARDVSWPTVISGFVLFRVFDMTKPWPIRKVERLPSGWGIVLDDVAAGMMAAAVLAGLRAARVVP
jgi:phosphatidylglycerophosphatase A